MQVRFYAPRLTEHEVSQLAELARRLNPQTFPTIRSWLFDWCTRDLERRQRGDNDVDFPEIGFWHPDDLAALNGELHTLVTTAVFTPEQEEFLHAVYAAVTARINVLLRHVAKGGNWRDTLALEESNAAPEET